MQSIAQFRQKISAYRDWAWDYPDHIFFSDDSWLAVVKRIYMLSRPFSHFVSSIVLTLLVISLAFSILSLPILSQGKNTFIEGVAVGVDSSGRLQTLSKISPLLPSAIQLEKDISELIYEPLIKYEQDTSISLVLAESIIRIQEGAEYEFVLKPDVFWHDGVRFSVDDVIRSLEIVSQLDESNTNSYVQAIKQMAWERTGERSILICTVRDRAEIAAIPNKCSGATGEKPILANFLELISIKIIPAHLAADINARTIDKPEPLLNRFPIGTGKYKFGGAVEKSITLIRNDNYHGALPIIPRIEFKLFRAEEQAVSALENGEIHAYATSSTEKLREIRSYPQVNMIESPVLFNQYWAIYFNLRKDPDGNAVGPNFFQDVSVRRAISAAVDRDRILEVLSEVGEEAEGPIPRTSEFYNANAGWYKFNRNQALKLLNDAGWVQVGRDGIRIKDGQRLSFKLSYVDTPDRNRVAEVIRQDLEAIGVEMVVDPHNLSDLTTQIVTPKQFDTLLYGMNTFIDPDRYELFHSAESAKLNLASYVGSDQTVKIEGSGTVRVPRVDKLLEQARSFDPLTAKAQRKDDYARIQELIAADVPVIFLYHPQFVYLINNRVGNLDLSNAGSIEQRFRNVSNWIL